MIATQQAINYLHRPHLACQIRYGGEVTALLYRTHGRMIQSHTKI